VNTDHTPTPNPPVDVLQLLDRVDDDRALLADLIEVFRNEYPGSLRAAQNAIESQSGHDLNRVAHALKGALLNLSATRASDLASQLEMIGQSNHIAGAQPVLDSLISEMVQVLRALEALCPVGAR
jgi:HPt (histidine-containing phosphotransfer) domain-containing protein